MKNRLPVLTAMVLLGIGGYVGQRSYWPRRQAADTSPVPAPVAGASGERPESTANTAAKTTAGDRLLLQARTQLERRPTVTARLRHRVALGDRQMHGVGGYWQQGSGDELRVRLELQVVGEETALLQISNGRFLWTDRRLPIGRSITRLDLRKLRNEANRASTELEDIEPGQATWFPPQPELSMRYGGLPTLLGTLAQSFTFEPQQAMRWTPDPPLKGVPEKFPVFAVVGHWQPDELAAMAPKSLTKGMLPERMPEEVLVLFGQQDLLPYRIEFRRRTAASAPQRPAGGVVPFQLSDRPLVLLELEDVRFDVPIAAGQFDFSPGDSEWDDCTAEYIDRVRRDHQEKLAARRRDRH